MALTFNKGKAPGTTPAPANAAKSPSLAFVKRGAQAKATMEQEDKRREQAMKGGVQRFWLPQDKPNSITFLDGNLVDGMLDIPFLYEHQINMNGSWRNWFICTQDSEPCPICEGDNKPYYAGFLTVIDHSEYKTKDGLTHKDTVKLFVAKRDTIKQLQLMATKRGGLRGCTFDVLRTGDKSPSVGSTFDFTEKLTDQQLKAKFKVSDPMDYNKLFTEAYMPAKELRKLGFGSMAGPVGGEAADDDIPFDKDL